MECENCAGTGTTIIAVIALILIIIFIIVAVVFFFFPSSQTILEVRGVNFDVINGQATGGGVTGTNNQESFPTGANNLYISQPLVGDITLTIQPSSLNFIGMTIGIKNITSDLSPTGAINLAPGSGVTLSPGGIDGGLTVFPGDFAWFVVTTTGNTQTFTRLE